MKGKVIFIVVVIVIFILAMIYILFQRPINDFVQTTVFKVEHFDAQEKVQDTVSTNTEKYDRTILGVISVIYDDGTAKVRVDESTVTVTLPNGLEEDELTPGDKVRVDVYNVYDKTNKKYIRTVYRLRK